VEAQERIDVTSAGRLRRRELEDGAVDDFAFIAVELNDGGASVGEERGGGSEGSEDEFGFDHDVVLLGGGCAGGAGVGEATFLQLPAVGAISYVYDKYHN